MTETIRPLPEPNELSRKYLTTRNPNSEVVSPQLEQKIRVIVDTLRSDEFMGLVDSGKITFAMIKPRLDEAVDETPKPSDDALAGRIIREIQAPLTVILQASFIFNEQMVDDFYAGNPKQNQVRIKPLDNLRYGKAHETRWDEFKALMQRGPVTGVILYTENGNAISEWRNQMGNDWDINKVKVKYPHSLRARYGTTNHNNLLHGSDSIDSVNREIAFFARALEAMISEN